MRNSHEELLNSVRESQKLSDEDEERLKDAINKFNENYEPRTQSIVDVSAGNEENEEEDEGSSENGSQEA